MKFKDLTSRLRNLARKVLPKKVRRLGGKILWRIWYLVFLFRNKLHIYSDCPEYILSQLNEVLTQVTPSQIVIKPWNGRHNVYAIFMLPIDDKSVKRLVVHIEGAGTYCGGAERVGTSFEGIDAQPGYYLVKAYLRTRTSTWLIVRGFGEQLNDPRNWRLINR